MGRYKNDKRELLLRAVISSGRLFETQKRCREERPNERFVIIVCDLRDGWGQAMATWDGSSTEDQRRGFDIWTFAFEMQAWKERRRKLTGVEDRFEHEGNAQAIHYAIISGRVPMLGTMLPNPRICRQPPL